MAAISPRPHENVKIEPDSTYIALDSADREIRVLDISPGAPGSPIVGSVRHTRLLQVDTIPYTALSYVWGNPNITTTITFNGVQVPVTMNLASALDHVRSPHEIVTFWVDALCINQKDNVEKSAQVAMMGDVYSAGTETRIWLGEERDGSDLAMDLIAQMDGEDLANEKNQLDEEGLKAIAHLQARDWWSRVWVIQEALLSKTSIVQCGNKCLPIGVFVRLDDIRRGWHRSSSRYIITQGSLIPGNPFSSILTEFHDEVFRIRSGRQSILQEWITSTEDFHATNPRDKIYALLSLAPPLETAHVVPDYSAPVTDIYSAVTVACIAMHQDLSVLHFDVDMKSDEHRLPSWVRDYSSSGNLGTKPIVPFSLDAYSACGRDRQGQRRKLSVQNILSDNPRHLRTRGVVVDSVIYVGPNERLETYAGIDPSERLASVKERAARTLANVKLWEEKFKGIDASPYDLREGREQVFWRTLMANRRFEKWLPHPHGMVENEYFETWMDRRPLPDSKMENCGPGIDVDEVKRLFCKPFTDACITRCHGRSFVITEKGYVGIAPLKSRIGDIVTVLEGGSVPFILRALDSGGCQFIGESYVHGIMEGEALKEKEDEIQMLVLE